jgi:hypothetical protein
MMAWNKQVDEFFPNSEIEYLFAEDGAVGFSGEEDA